MIFGCFEDCVLYPSVMFKKKQGKQWENDAKALESGVTQLLDKPWWFHILLSIQLGWSWFMIRMMMTMMMMMQYEYFVHVLLTLRLPIRSTRVYDLWHYMTIFQGGKPPTRLGWGGPGVSKIGLAKTPWWLTGLNHDENEVATGEPDRTNVQEGNVKPISWRSEIQNVDPFWSLLYALEASVGLFIRQGIGSRLRAILRIRYPLPRRVLTAVAATELFHPRLGWSHWSAGWNSTITTHSLRQRQRHAFWATSLWQWFQWPVAWLLR